MQHWLSVSQITSSVNPPIFFPSQRCHSLHDLRSRVNLNRQVFYSSFFSEHRDGIRSKLCSLNASSPSSDEVALQEKMPPAEETLPFKVSAGRAAPLGVSLAENGINFALFSENATAVSLCLYPSPCLEPDTREDDMIELTLDPLINKTGKIWHLCVQGLPPKNVRYGYRVDGPRDWKSGHRFDNTIILIDPYAKLIEGRRLFADETNKTTKFFGTYDLSTPPFDWGDDYKRPNLPEKDLIIYEMNVRAFTADQSSGLDSTLRGSYLGVINKIPHLLQLGVNAVELLPIFEFDEFEFQRRRNPRDHMINTWGYSTINYFAPMSRYASNGGGPSRALSEFKEMVKALHKAGIEVILDVVYNHTNEADDEFPYPTSFRGIDNKVYYMVNNNGQLLNYTGCGHTLNCNHPVVMDLILESLRHWVTECHVDGFRFDLASVLCRGTDGSPLNSPPLIRAIAKDETLSACKIIAEPWDCGGLYLVGGFPNWDRWAEWNGKYRDVVRRFVKGDSGMKGPFATCLSGSADLYRVNKRKPCHSVNFVVAHDGFTVRDLVSFDYKHNEENGERGNDGSNDNFSWNCGVEGETGDPRIAALRARQMKNFHLALMISQGVPMMLMGDEYGHTRHGNNNSYGHDSRLNFFLWNIAEGQKATHFRFFSQVIALRKSRPVFRHADFLTHRDVTWHEDNWDNSDSKFLAFTLHDVGGGDILVAFNAHDYFVKMDVPSPPSNRNWFRVVDTNLDSPEDIVMDGVSGVRSFYNVAPYSSILLEAKSF